jgi:two-component system, LytTR family, sensor kinase
MAPHFLYNTLNSLYALAIDGNEKLGPAILDLSELMRYIAKHQDEEVTLGTEMDQVERYIGSQRSRYVKPLQVSIEVDEASRSAGIPVMVLLPLIENAFKHGEPCDERMPVRLAARASEGTITITCTNRIAKEVGPREPGTGCHNLRRRLELLRGPNARAFFGPMDDRMYKAELVFPYTA